MLHVLPAVRDAFDSCRRTYATFCLALESEFLGGVELLAGLVEEAFEDGERDAWLVEAPDLEKPGTWTAQAMHYDWKELFSRPVTWRAAVEDAGSGFTIDDLCTSPDLTIHLKADGTLRRLDLGPRSRAASGEMLAIYTGDQRYRDERSRGESEGWGVSHTSLTDGPHFDGRLRTLYWPLLLFTRPDGPVRTHPDG